MSDFPSILVDQPSFPGFCAVTEAANALSIGSGAELRGAVFTRKEVVEFILDLVGYRADRNLYERRILEPSFGGGDFLLPSVSRLLESRDKALESGKPVQSLRSCVRAVELHKATFQRTRQALAGLLLSHGFSSCECDELLDHWLVHGDFLLAPMESEFDYIVGNPPYVRQELIPSALLGEYRRRFSTLYDRADLYIPFIERSLRLLAQGGQLGFICADRWVKNKYGGPLRAMISKDYWLRSYVDMSGSDAFHADVAAYPAITVISRDASGPTRVAQQPEIEPQTLAKLAEAMTEPEPSPLFKEIPGVVAGSAPWVLKSTDSIDLVRRVESRFPRLEEAGCKVGIGVATGADKAFIGKFDELDVEPDRKLPIAMTRDIVDGNLEWRGYGVVNPFTNEGGLVDLAEYPRLRAYFAARKNQIVERHVAKKSPANWYRTIDRITPSLATRSKLLIPDIKGKAQVAYEEGRLYPHHNLYFVVSETWDLHALQAVLLSDLTRLFVATYSTKMRGGFLRFQAQYLRRIRIPKWETVPTALREQLKSAAVQFNVAACNEAVAELYSINEQERQALSNAE